MKTAKMTGGRTFLEKVVRAYFQFREGRTAIRTMPIIREQTAPGSTTLTAVKKKEHSTRHQFSRETLGAFLIILLTL